MSSAAPPFSRIDLPSGWNVANVTIHFEGEAPSNEPSPFAANMTVQLRTDARRGSSPADIASADLSILRASLRGFELLNSGDLDVGGKKVPHHELELAADGGGARLRQMMVYFDRGGHAYTLVATHVSDRFSRIRGDVLAFLGTLLVERV